MELKLLKLRLPLVSSNTIRRLLFSFLIGFSLISIQFLSVPGVSAHAQLDDSNPKPNEILKESPKQIVLTFTQSVNSTDNSIQLFDDAGKKISLNSKIIALSNSQIQAYISELDTGTYVVNWNVVSADSHKISGTFTFSVSLEGEKVQEIDLSVVQKIVLSNTSETYYGLATVFRWAIFVSAALLISISILYALSVLTGDPRTLRKILLAAIVICILATLASIFAQNAALDGKTFLESSSITSIRDQLEFRFGQSGIIRIIACLLLLITSFKKQLFAYLTPALVVIIVATLTYSGHSSAGEMISLAAPASMIHIFSTSIWFGGLVILLISKKLNSIKIDIAKFSKIAFGCVIATVITGIFASWRQVGSFENARNSWFGELLSYKVMLVAVTIIVAFFTRRFLKKENNEKMRFLVLVEVIIILGIFALTSVLAAQVPSKQSAELPVTAKTVTKNGILEVSANPAKAGDSVLHIFIYDIKGIPIQPEKGTLGNPAIKVTLSNEEKHVDPIPVAMRYEGFNHFTSAGLNVPFPGEWKIIVRIQINDFDEIADQVTVKFR